MPHTKYPNGVTVSTSTSVGVRTVDGEMYADSLTVPGTANITGAASFGGSLIGQVVTVPVYFTTVSAAQVYSVAAPFTGDLIGAYVTIGATSAVAAAYTVRNGSGGTVLVSSETNTITTAYGQESLAIDAASVTTASGIQVTRGVQGTTGDTTLSLLFKRTA